MTKSTPTTVALLAAEAVGTFVLLLAILLSGNPLAVGLGLAVAAYAFGDISGCHVNPVVTGVILAQGKIPAGRAGMYVGAQIVGGLLAFGLWRLLHSSPADPQHAIVGNDDE
jgi:glycerol uptake facilitator-like aquaporin